MKKRKAIITLAMALTVSQATCILALWEAEATEAAMTSGKRWTK